MDINNKFELDQKVRIIPFDGKNGRIEGLYYCHCGLKYYVSFYVDFAEKAEYFYENELEAVS